MRPPSTDVITLDRLSLTATIGPDAWHRTRPQPLLLSVHLHLHPGALVLAATTDNVRLTVFYWELANALYALGDAAAVAWEDERAAGGDAQFVVPAGERAHTRPEDLVPWTRRTPDDDDGARRGFPSALALARHATLLAVRYGGAAAAEVRVELHAPKAALRAARGLVWEVTTPTGAGAGAGEVAVHAGGLALAVVVGVNPEERVRRQRLELDIWFVEDADAVCVRGAPEVDYAAIVDSVAEEMEASAFRTLEKFVHEACRAACVASARVREATVRASKPGAISAAEGLTLQLTRPRSAFVRA